MEIRDVFARNLRAIRHEKGISQEDLADRASIDRTYISSLERGKCNPTVLIVERLAKALGVPIALLVVTTSEREVLPKNLQPGPRRKPVTRKAR